MDVKHVQMKYSSTSKGIQQVIKEPDNWTNYTSGYRLPCQQFVTGKIKGFENCFASQK